MTIPDSQGSLIETVVQIDRLGYAYGDHVALDELSLTVNRGEVFGLLGPNGSGKTTLFRILSTLIAAPAERVKLFGMDLALARDEIRRRIGVVFQSPSLDKQLTARENLIHQGHLYGLAGKQLQSRADEMLARVNLLDRQHEYVGKFSGGMRRRVEVAKGLLHKPELLILDEPSTGLDPGARIDMWKTLKEIRQNDGVTVLLTTHLMEEADQCDRLAILHRGKLMACDTPSNLKSTIGGDVVIVTTNSPAEATAILQSQLGLNVQEIDGRLRVEVSAGHQQIPPDCRVASGPGRIDIDGPPHLAGRVRPAHWPRLESAEPTPPARQPSH